MPIDQLIGLIFILLSGILIIYHDLTRNMIPNYITYAGILLGLLLLVFFRRADYSSYLWGFLGGGGLFYALYLLGWLGGGDVKLIAMIGLLAGMRFLIESLFYITLAGGVIAFLYMIALLCQRKNIREAKIPYGTAIVVGVYISFFMDIVR